MILNKSLKGLNMNNPGFSTPGKNANNEPRPRRNKIEKQLWLRTEKSKA